MRYFVTIGMIAVVGSMVAACMDLETFTEIYQKDTGSDAPTSTEQGSTATATDPESGTDDSESSTDTVEDSQETDSVLIPAADCEDSIDNGWPCSCENTATCADGLTCAGGLTLDFGICTPTASQPETGICDSLSPGIYGEEVIEVCGTWLSRDNCICLPAGCNEHADCPHFGICIEKGCIDDYPGCEVADEADLQKVCVPSNY